MAVGCGGKTSKFILFVINVLVWFASIALVAIGAYVLSNSEEYSNLFGEDTNTLTVVCGTTIGTGCFIFLVAFLGCCGACAENKCFLKLYFVFLLLLAIVEVVGGILAFVFKNDIQDIITNELEKQVINDYGVHGQDVITDSIDAIQRDNNCCGATNYTDYEESVFVNTTVGKAVPESCCKTVTDTCNNVPLNVNLIYTEGCNGPVIDFFDDNFVFVGVAALCLVVVELLAMMMTCCLISGIGKDSYQSV